MVRRAVDRRRRSPRAPPAVLSESRGARSEEFDIAGAVGRATPPLVLFSIFRLPSLRSSNMATLLLLGAVVTVFFFASLFMQQVLDYSALKTGNGLRPARGHRRGRRRSRLWGGGEAAGEARVDGLLMLSRLPSDAGYAADVLPAFLIIGLGIGLAFVPLQVAAQIGVHEHQAGLAAGLINTSQELGGALGVAVAASIAFSRVAELTRLAGRADRGRRQLAAGR